MAYGNPHNPHNPKKKKDVIGRLMEAMEDDDVGSRVDVLIAKNVKKKSDKDKEPKRKSAKGQKSMRKAFGYKEPDPKPDPEPEPEGDSLGEMIADSLKKRRDSMILKLKQKYNEKQKKKDNKLVNGY